jgi:hypothetical protein
VESFVDFSDQCWRLQHCIPSGFLVFVSLGWQFNGESRDSHRTSQKMIQKLLDDKENNEHERDSKSGFNQSLSNEEALLCFIDSKSMEKVIQMFVSFVKRFLKDFVMENMLLNMLE